MQVLATDDLLSGIEEAQQRALYEGKSLIYLRHVLLGILSVDEEVIRFIKFCGTSQELIMTRAMLYNSHVQGSQGGEISSRTRDSSETDQKASILPFLLDEQAKRVINKAREYSAREFNGVVNGIMVLMMALEEEEDDFIENIFLKMNINKSKLLSWIEAAKSREKDPPAFMVDDTNLVGEVMKAVRKAQNTVEKQTRKRKQAQQRQPENSALAYFCVNLNEKLQAQDYPRTRFIGRQQEIRRVMQVLTRHSKASPMLVGEPGVGKTAIAEGLAQMIVDKQAPYPLSEMTVYSLDLGLMVSGTRYRGDFEERILALSQELQERKDIILFIDEIHTLIGAGNGAGGLDAANLLKPLLQDGSIRCIGATTYKEYRKHVADDAALARRFQIIDVREPDTEEARAILEGVKVTLETYHGVVITDEAIDAALRLSVKYLYSRKLPDKAIDVLDEAAASVRLNCSQWSPDHIPSVGEKAVVGVISDMAKVPSHSISRDEKKSLKALEGSLASVIFGQEEAVKELSSSIKLARAGLSNPEKPLGAYLFAGPTGVGKTETARQLAKVLGTELVRIDMSEFSEPHSISRLIGSPPGYVGYNEEGVLTGRVAKSPYCVLLLDEFEKSHPQVWTLLLQVMDYGRLTDGAGNVVDFRNVILILSSNIGIQQSSKPALGFARDDRRGEDDEVIEATLSPEFRNRLTRIVKFKPLERATVLKVVDKFMGQLRSQLAEKNVSLVVSKSLKEWLANKGYDPVMGARPLERLIHEKIKRPLADEILFGKLEKGGKVRLSVKGDEVSVKYGAK